MRRPLTLLLSIATVFAACTSQATVETTSSAPESTTLSTSSTSTTSSSATTAAGSAPTTVVVEPATLALIGDPVLTMDPAQSRAEAVAVRGNVIVAVGSDDEIDRWGAGDFAPQWIEFALGSEMRVVGCGSRSASLRKGSRDMSFLAVSPTGSWSAWANWRAMPPIST